MEKNYDKFNTTPLTSQMKMKDVCNGFLSARTRLLSLEMSIT